MGGAADARLGNALSLHAAGRLADAEALYRAILADDEKHPDALHLLGVLRYQAGDYDSASALIDRALALAPDNALYHMNRGLVLAALQMHDDALASFARAIALNPESADSYINRAATYLECNRISEALTDYDKAIALAPNNAEAHFNRGLALARALRPDAAIESYDRAIALVPRWAPAHVSRGDALQNLAAFTAAIESYDRALRLDPTLIQAHVNRGIALQVLRRPADALESFEKALGLAPDNAEVYAGRAKSLYALGRLDEALENCTHALAQTPGLPQALYYRGLIFQEHGRDAEALADFEAACRNAPAYLDPQVRRFWAGLATAPGDTRTEDLCRDTAQLAAQQEADRLRLEKSIRPFRLTHDLEQARYLRATDAAIAELDDVIGILAQAAARISTGDTRISLSAGEAETLAQFRTTVLRHPVASPNGPCLNPDNDWRAIEAAYLAGRPEIVHIDNFLTPDALAALRAFCLRSTVWRTEYDDEYLGAFAHRGFLSPLHIQIADELRRKMPGIFKDDPLEQLWAFKYASRLGKGINVHADFAQVNLNFWITDDTANLGTEGGGLVIYDVPAPPSWSFDDYNTNDARIYTFLKESGAQRRVVPYRCNRAVLFNSALFHETDRFTFAEGYENRRINITYLFGKGLKTR